MCVGGGGEGCGGVPFSREVGVGWGGGGQRHVDRFVLLGSKFQSDSI